MFPTKNSAPSSSRSREEEDQTGVNEKAEHIGKEVSPIALTAQEERRIWRKVDLRLMPILSLIYLLSVMDKGNIGNAKLEGLVTQLNLTGNRYNIALTMYYIPYCVFEFPCNLLLKVVRPSRWLPGLAILWGIVMALMSLVKTYPQLVTVRVCLGIAEAGLFPGIAYYLTFWYPRNMLQFHIALFSGAASLAGAFSGLLAYAISYLNGKGGLEGWAWIFLIEGLATVAVGILAHFVLADFPQTAKFLTAEERAFVVAKNKYDHSPSGEEDRFEARHVWAAFTDWQVWMHILILISVDAAIFGITLFLPLIQSSTGMLHLLFLRASAYILAVPCSFGYSTTISQLLTVPPYVVATACTITAAYYSDKLGIRSPFILAGLVACVVGYLINISDAPAGVKYFGTFFCVAGSYSAGPGAIAWLGNNLVGEYKRAVGMALQIAMGNFTGAIVSNIYRSQDSPRFILGHALELMFVGIGLVCVPIVVLLYRRINNQRDRLWQKGEGRDSGGDASDFRYML
ncbi:MFS general substrate transporter [Leucogyrophana mollusca]|uniref:MFS general substrate transporter n=1 Tax=Leucogyrophana mollusca TaxID=85980 RepID=A0ACB8BSJ9_9AGAM|nr:MFS general substrate transporter [Leucogyrophana mollusca]